jgi:hypothetical protein
MASRQRIDPYKPLRDFSPGLASGDMPFLQLAKGKAR